MGSHAWEMWKKAFGIWENHTADYLEKVLRNPLILQPSGTLLGLAMRYKAAADRAAAVGWSMVGLPTKRDQERGLHKLNQIESKLLDLEDKLADLEQMLQKSARKSQK